MSDLSPAIQDALATHDRWLIDTHAAVRLLAAIASVDHNGDRRIVIPNEAFDTLNRKFCPPGFEHEAERFRPDVELMVFAWEGLTVVRLDPLPGGSPSCRECGCWDQRACPGGCFWVEPDLCSSCAETKADEDAYRNRPTRPALFPEGEPIEILVARLSDGSDHLLAIRGRPADWIQQNWGDYDTADEIGLPKTPGLYGFRGTWEQIEVPDFYSGGTESEDRWLGECRIATPEDLYLLDDQASVPITDAPSVEGSL